MPSGVDVRAGEARVGAPHSVAGLCPGDGQLQALSSLPERVPAEVSAPGFCGHIALMASMPWVLLAAEVGMLRGYWHQVTPFRFGCSANVTLGPLLWRRARPYGGSAASR
jgi:hypothetical protein